METCEKCGIQYQSSPDGCPVCNVQRAVPREQQQLPEVTTDTVTEAPPPSSGENPLIVAKIYSYLYIIIGWGWIVGGLFTLLRGLCPVIGFIIIGLIFMIAGKELAKQEGNAIVLLSFLAAMSIAFGIYLVATNSPAELSFSILAISLALYLPPILEACHNWNKYRPIVLNKPMK